MRSSSGIDVPTLRAYGRDIFLYQGLTTPALAVSAHPGLQEQHAAYIARPELKFWCHPPWEDLAGRFGAIHPVGNPPGWHNSIT